jgi:hypothetical protein
MTEVSFGLNRNNSNSSERTASGSLLSCVAGAGKDFFWAGADWATAAIELVAKIVRKSANSATPDQGCRILRTIGLRHRIKLHA